MPKSGDGELSPWHAFSIDNSTWNGANTDPFGGRTYDASAVHGPTTAWYPASGFRETSSFFAHAGTFTHNWPSTAGYQFHTTAVAVNPEYPYEGRSRAYSVRCIRE